jgi:hypothetical protein
MASEEGDDLRPMDENAPLDLSKTVTSGGGLYVQEIVPIVDRVLRLLASSFLQRLPKQKSGWSR